MIFTTLVIARSELRKVLCLAVSVTFFFFLYEISRERLNGFAPNSQGRRVWSLARTSLKDKVNFGGICALVLLLANVNSHCRSLYMLSPVRLSSDVSK